MWILEWIPRLLVKGAYFAQAFGWGIWRFVGKWLVHLTWITSANKQKQFPTFQQFDKCIGFADWLVSYSEDKTWQGPTILLCPTYKAIARVSCTSFPVKELDHQVQLGQQTLRNIPLGDEVNLHVWKGRVCSRGLLAILKTSDIICSSSPFSSRCFCRRVCYFQNMQGAEGGSKTTTPLQ